MALTRLREMIPSRNQLMWMLLSSMVHGVRAGMGGKMGDSDSKPTMTDSAGFSSPTDYGDDDDDDDAPPTRMDFYNRRFVDRLYYLMAAMLALLIVWQLLDHIIHHVRQAAASAAGVDVRRSNETQRLFAAPNPRFSWWKEHLIYAPVGRVRHNRALYISKIDFGALPTRLQGLFLAAYVGVNIVFIVVDIDWTANKRGLYATIRNRCGMLAIANLTPLMLFASRHNPMIDLLNVSFDSFNMLHRWMGRVTAAEGIVHAIMWFVYKLEIDRHGWEGVRRAIMMDTMIWTGLIALCAFIGLIMFSPAAFRHRWYEIFLHLHQLFAVALFVGAWMHIWGNYTMPFLVAALVVWAAERTWRIVIIVYRNIGNGGTKAMLEALPGGAVRVTIAMARPWRFYPGQHLFIYVPSVGLWTSHPFSVAWSDETDMVSSEKGMAMTRQDTMQMRRTTMSLVLRKQRGFTASLYKKAEQGVDGKVTVWAMVEGPRGALHSLHSYGTIVLFAGGVGITHQVPYVRDLVAGYANGTIAARRVVLIWIIQTPEHLEWVRPWMTQILGMERRSEVLRIMLFVTRPRSPTEVQSPSSTVSMFPGKPNIETLIDMEIEAQIGAMAVSVCGPGSLSDDVRTIVRRRQQIANIDYVEESFSW